MSHVFSVEWFWKGRLKPYTPEDADYNAEDIGFGRLGIGEDGIKTQSQLKVLEERGAALVRKVHGTCLGFRV